MTSNLFFKIWKLLVIWAQFSDPHNNIKGYLESVSLLLNMFLKTLYLKRNNLIMFQT